MCMDTKYVKSHPVISIMLLYICCLQGVPIRVEIGPKDLKAQQLVAVRRDSSTKITIPLSNAPENLKKMLDDIHSSLLAR